MIASLLKLSPKEFTSKALLIPRLKSLIFPDYFEPNDKFADYFEQG
jgi:hypothetical protein